MVPRITPSPLIASLPQLSHSQTSNLKPRTTIKTKQNDTPPVPIWESTQNNSQPQEK